MRIFAQWAAVAALACAPAAAIADPAVATIAPADRQNFVVTRPGELVFVGDPNRYDIELPTDVLFDFDKSRLRPESKPLIDKLIAHLRAHKASQVHVRGHTDSKGSDSHNFTLSQKRAKAVCDILEREIGGFNMCIGRGEQEPVVPNENPDGSDNPLNRQLNRRVTVSVLRYPDVNEMLNDARTKSRPALEGARPKQPPPD